MSDTSSLETLIELAEGDRDSAAKLLGELRSARQKENSQLELLLQYREDYRSRFEAAMQRGITIAAMQNYQRFLASLDNAIKHQRNQLNHSDGRVQRGEDNWRQQQKKVNSYDALRSRRHQEANKRARRLEQQQNDEFASRASSALDGL
ncbi:flagellar export protein FliJ [Kushneria aurantia]|uniref:Flagellar FliJ protein n=1 Tax=Kushneria aurantia TaxID=504092 RepID=A0ABV6G0X5_9GAMM|nr:flagellar export protein FliJ [Kushneria aurantia]